MVVVRIVLKHGFHAFTAQPGGEIFCLRNHVAFALVPRAVAGRLFQTAYAYLGITFLRILRRNEFKKAAVMPPH